MKLNKGPEKNKFLISGELPQATCLPASLPAMLAQQAGWRAGSEPFQMGKLFFSGPL
ncbi:MAG: hypothetical protein H6559_14155 [Lewinellaceae bacterium]|nr:hypothetical protein [Lewinellaceae bacterium]